VEAKSVAPSGDFASWKALGIDAIIKSKILRGTALGAYTINLTAVDILEGSISVEQDETFHNNRELIAHLKHFVDRLLEVYTKRPGMFSSRIVFIGKRERKQEGQVFLCDIDGQNVEQITFAPKIPHLSPSWSADGTKILYTSYSKGKPDLYMYEVATGKVDRIASSGAVSSGGVFSRNGKVVAFSESSRGLTNIYLKNLGKNVTRPLNTASRGLNVDPSFSPDEKWLATVSDRFGNPHIFLSLLSWSADGESVSVLEEKRITYAGKQNVTPAWSPDSKKIAFGGLDPTVGKFDVFKMNADGSYLERLTQFEGSNENPSWSPNGQHLVFHSNRSGAAQLFIMQKDGASQKIIPTGLYEAKTPDWGPQRK
jgi:TolB protein